MPHAFVFGAGMEWRMLNSSKSNDNDVSYQVALLLDR